MTGVDTSKQIRIVFQNDNDDEKNFVYDVDSCISHTAVLYISKQISNSILERKLCSYYINFEFLSKLCEFKKKGSF